MNKITLTNATSKLIRNNSESDLQFKGQTVQPKFLATRMASRQSTKAHRQIVQNALHCLGPTSNG